MRTKKTYLSADIITIMLGTNDTKPQNWDSYGSEFTSDYKALIDTLSNSNRNAKIFLVVPPPVWKNPYGIRNEIIQLEIPIIKEISKRKGLKVIDANTPFLQDINYFADGVHPNDLGAYSIAGLIYRSIALCEKPGPDSTGFN
jgi:lysophospholipase L1-like esterase